MRNILAAAVVTILSAVVAGCSSEPPCTSEILAKKGQDLAAAMQAAVLKDPTQATTLAAKVQEIAAKYQGKSEAEACKAYDDLIAAMKG